MCKICSGTTGACIGYCSGPSMVVGYSAPTYRPPPDPKKTQKIFNTLEIIESRKSKIEEDIKEMNFITH